MVIKSYTSKTTMAFLAIFVITTALVISGTRAIIHTPVYFIDNEQLFQTSALLPAKEIAEDPNDKNEANDHVVKTIIEREGHNLTREPLPVNLELSYISKPSCSSVDILCRANQSDTYVRIICPLVDRVDEENAVQEVKLTNCKKMAATSHSEKAYTSCNRTVRWKSLSNYTEFSCMCKPCTTVTSNVAKVLIVVTRFNNTVKKTYNKRTNARKYARLRCHLNGVPRPRITWFKDGKVLDLQETRGRAKHFSMGNGHVLSISRAERKESGEYKCVGSNIAGKDSGIPYVVNIVGGKGKSRRHRGRSNRTSTRPTHPKSSTNEKANKKNNKKANEKSNEKANEKATHNKQHEFVDEKQLHNDEDSLAMDNESDRVSNNAYIISIAISIVVVALVVIIIFLAKLKYIQCNNLLTLRYLRDVPRLRATLQGYRTCYTGWQDPAPGSVSEISNIIRFLDNPPPDADPRFYTSKLLDHNGGVLFMENADIRLIVPEGAIPEGKTEVFYIALTEKEKYFPSGLHDNESLVTHIVMCGPHGVRFEKPVILILPHWAGSRKNVRNYRVLRSNTAPGEDPNWFEDTNSEGKPSEDCFCSMSDNYFTLMVWHFSWSAIPANTPEKQYCLATYCPRSAPSGIFAIRIYCMPDVEKFHAEIENNESKKLGGDWASAKKPITLYENGGDLLFTCTIDQMSRGWSVANNNHERPKAMKYSTLWNCTKTAPVLQYDMRYGGVAGPPQGSLYCIFNAIQKELQEINPDGEEITVEATFPLTHQVDAGRGARGSLPSVASSGYSSSGAGARRVIGFLSQELKDKLSELLHLSRHELANKLGVEAVVVPWLENSSAGPRQDPVRYILDTWEHTMACSPEKAMKTLRDILVVMAEHEAAKEVSKYCINHETVV